MRIIKIFPVNSVKSEFGNAEKVQFQWFFVTGDM